MLTHLPSTVAVFQSDNYKSFSFIAGNRPLNENKIKKIIKEIEGGNDVLQYYPIQVKVEDNKLLILDGQHRFFISKKLKRAVNYILVHENKTMIDIAKINSNTEKWSVANYINCYVQAKNQNYIILKKFMDEYGFSVGVCLNMLSNGTSGNATGGSRLLTNHFENGEFMVKTPDEAKELAEKVKRFSAFTNWRSRVFVFAIVRLLQANKYPFDDIVAAFEKHKDTYQDKAHWKDHLTQLETIVNIGKKIRVAIY
jgi:hypothetical protein